MTRGWKLGLIAALAMAPLQASAFRAWNQHDVVEVSPGVIEVVSRVGSASLDFWCGAGDYARRVWNIRRNPPIYIVSPLGPSTVKQGYKAVQFSLTEPPSGAVSPSFTISVTRVGENMGVSFAEGYCRDSEFYFLFPAGGNR